MRNTIKLTTVVLVAGALTSRPRSLRLRQGQGHRQRQGRLLRPADRRRQPHPARPDPELRPRPPGEEGRPRPPGQGVLRLRPAQHRHRAGRRRRQLLPAQALPGRLQPEERHPHRARGECRTGAAGPVLAQDQDHRRPQGRRRRGHTERHHQRGPRAQAPVRQRAHRAQGKHRPDRDPRRCDVQPQAPEVQGAGGRPAAALAGRRRRRMWSTATTRCSPVSAPPRTR